MKALASAFGLSLLLAGAALAQDSVNVRRVGGFPTSPNRALGVAVGGDYPYMLTDDALRDLHAP